MIHPLWVILLWLRFPLTITLAFVAILTLLILADRHTPSHADHPRHALHHPYRHER